MYLLIKTFAKFLNLLNSETSPSQISAGFCFGMIVGLSPFFTWHNLIVFFVVALLRVNFSMFFMSTALFAILGFFLDPLFDAFGYWILVDLSFLRSLWVSISSAPILPFFRLNNTVVIGSLALSLILFIPGFFCFRFAIIQYRSRWKAKIASSKFMKALKGTKFYGFYEKYRSLKAKWEVFS